MAVRNKNVTIWRATGLDEHDAAVSTHQISFVPNWIWREVVTVGAFSAALPGTYAPLPLIRDATRAPKLARLNRLKASARNWTFIFSPSRLWFLKSEKSK